MSEWKYIPEVLEHGIHVAGRGPQLTRDGHFVAKVYGPTPAKAEELAKFIVRACNDLESYLLDNAYREELQRKANERAFKLK